MKNQRKAITKKFQFLIMFIALSICSYGQKTYDLKDPGPEKLSKCDCLGTLQVMPPEVQFGVFRDANNDLYFMLTDKAWFGQLIKGKKDGIAIDIVKKNQYNCEGDNSFANSRIHRGTLTPPVYRNELQANALPSERDNFITKVGKVPSDLVNDDLEYNLIIINNNYVCYNTHFVNVITERWELLEMGLFMDTLSTSTTAEAQTEQNKTIKYILNNKRLQFTIPFEKNKSNYSAKDIKPIYDSLHLSNFNIKKITIKAFSSVEGSTERNMELQEKRAQSILEAMQSFQNINIITQVSSSENWIEFLHDIAGSPYGNLASLSKQEIKKKLQDKKILDGLEPILSKHRKAILILDLDKKSLYAQYDPMKLLSIFEKSIEEKNLDKALEIQHAIFARMRDHTAPEDLLDKIEIPKQVQYGSLLLNQSAYAYETTKKSHYATLLEFQELDIILPQNGHLKYNIVVLKLKCWLFAELIVDPIMFKKEIQALKTYGIPTKLIRRLMLNYHIIYGEYLMAQKKYKEKDMAVKYINTNYRKVGLQGEDLVRLAQYFSSYAKYEWGIKVLAPHISRIDVEENLIFYYINLTIYDPAIIKRASYRKTLINAASINKERFCKIFDSSEKGGISFQLLNSDYLKASYCENCQ
ncbi:MAG: hypothetical protein COC01_00470 [Bacteroidetes bacterium]|nr:MAG: hypothetical protein COC01_00470 [Bacteroidota bacterium]